jgi:type III pantothenate kinase
MILALDIGNSDTTIGLFESGDLLEHWRIATRTDRSVDELGLLLRALLRESGFGSEFVRVAVIGSVVPTATRSFADACQAHIGVRAVTIDAATSLPVRLDVEEPASVGADRIANSLAIATIHQRDAIVVDLGTATTFDCISANGTFHGGVIAPGILIAADTLVRSTARLPGVDIAPPATTIGRRTDAAMRSGIFFGAVESIDGLVRRIQQEWNRPAPLVIATGGLASLIAPHCASIHKIDPFLTIHGLELAYRFIEEQESGIRVTPLKRKRARGR